MFKSKICFADRRVIPWLMAVFFILGLTIPCNALSTTSAIPQVLSKKVTELNTATRARIVESYGRLPLSFEANHGQTDEKVKFLSRGSGYNLFLTSTEAVLSLRKPQAENKAAQGSAPHKADKPKPATVVSMKLVGANPDSKITGANQLPGKVNYFLGKDAKKWRINIPTYARVKYTNVYPGIDLVFYGQGQKLEYDFIVAPGADHETIALCFGQTRLKIEQNGDLALDTKGGELCLQKPLIYQDIDGIRKPVPGGYVLHPVKNEKQTHRVGFKVAAYDRTRPLVIDPVLIYSTYLGGSTPDSGYGIAVDATGNCYVTGYTRSTDFPTHVPLYPNYAGNCDAFVSKISVIFSAPGITGRITDEQEEPVADVNLTLGGDGSGVTTTGSDGAYHFDIGTPGMYTVTADGAYFPQNEAGIAQREIEIIDSAYGATDVNFTAVSTAPNVKLLFPRTGDRLKGDFGIFGTAYKNEPCNDPGCEY